MYVYLFNLTLGSFVYSLLLPLAITSIAMTNVGFGGTHVSVTRKNSEPKPTFYPFILYGILFVEENNN